MKNLIRLFSQGHLSSLVHNGAKYPSAKAKVLRELKQAIRDIDIFHRGTCAKCRYGERTDGSTMCVDCLFGDSGEIEFVPEEERPVRCGICKQLSVPSGMTDIKLDDGRGFMCMVCARADTDSGADDS